MERNVIIFSDSQTYTFTPKEIYNILKTRKNGYAKLPFSDNWVKDLDITLRGDRSTFVLRPTVYKSRHIPISKIFPANDKDEEVSMIEEKLGHSLCMNIVLDIDGTLVKDVNDPDIIPEPRPYLKEFFQYIFKTFCHVSIWTASHKERAERIIDTVFLPILKELNPDYSFDFVWTAEKVAVKQKWRLGGDYTSTVIKDLKKVYKAYKYYTKDNTVILDDTSSTYRRNHGNAIGLVTWRGDPNDKELLKVLENIEGWKGEAEEQGTVRHVRKFSWPI
jgi:hypothetical protein